VNDRVALFLYEFRHIEADYEIPGEVTQSGIASGVGMSVTHVPRAVKKLEEFDFVFSKSSYVKGSARKKKTYHLTSEGIVKYRDLRCSLGNQEVKVLASGKESSMTLDKAFKALVTISQEEDTPAPLFFNMLLFVSEDDVFDQEAFLKGSGSTPTGLQAIIQPLYGREKDIDTLVAALQKGSVVLVSGEEGMGKTSVVQAALSRLTGVQVLDENLSIANDLDETNVAELIGDEDMSKKELDSLLHLTGGNPRKILAALDVDVDLEDLPDDQKALLRILKSE
jgi:DNA-binding MarR family transcriptional regulator